MQRNGPNIIQLKCEILLRDLGPYSERSRHEGIRGKCDFANLFLKKKNEIICWFGTGEKNGLKQNGGLCGKWCAQFYLCVRVTKR